MFAIRAVVATTISEARANFPERLPNAYRTGARAIHGANKPRFALGLRLALRSGLAGLQEVLAPWSTPPAGAVDFLFGTPRGPTLSHQPSRAVRAKGRA